MEHLHPRSAYQLWQRLSIRLSALPQSAPIRRRLYGTLFLITACIAGWSSAESLKQESILAWKEKKTVPTSIWKLAAEKQGLRLIVDEKQLRPWYSRWPREMVPLSAWWDSTHQALWVSPSAESSENLLFFSKTPRPTRENPSWVFLGKNWDALETFLSIQIASPADKPRTKTKKAAAADPRLWNF